jgi:phospholipid transport system substrate-binding protein
MRGLPTALLAACIGTTLATPCIGARIAAPEEVLKSATQDVIAIIRQDKSIQAGNPTKVAELVEMRILPHFDFNRMTRIAAARTWRLATPEQQQSLTTEFKTLVVHTYATALSVYRDRAIEFKQLRAAPDDNAITVKSTVRQAGAAPLSMDYEMEKSALGWKVYDIKIEGVSLITNYRSTFTAKVNEAGIDGLIKSLAEKNRQGAGSLRAQDETFYLPAFIRSIMQGLGNRRVGVSAPMP